MKWDHARLRLLPYAALRTSTQTRMCSLRFHLQSFHRAGQHRALAWSTDARALSLEVVCVVTCLVDEYSSVVCQLRYPVSAVRLQGI